MPSQTGMNLSHSPHQQFPLIHLCLVLSAYHYITFSSTLDTIFPPYNALCELGETHAGRKR